MTASWWRNPEVRGLALALAGVTVVAAVVAWLVSGAPAALWALVAGVASAALALAFTWARYRRLAALAASVDRVLHGGEGAEFEAVREGELSILTSEIHKMTVRLRENAETLRADTAFLAASLADVAHQLRTPLTSIRMLTDFLARPGLDEAARLGYVRELDTLTTRIDWLLTSLLALSRLDAGTIAFTRESVGVRTLLDRALAPLAIPLELRDITVRVRADEATSLVVDPNWTAEAVGNIVKNCLEHAPSGGHIDLTCTQNAVFTEVVITDDGPGFAAEDLPHVFERFYHGASTTGVGIGLALCRLILAAQDATVRADNRPEGGARFTIRFYEAGVTISSH